MAEPPVTRARPGALSLLAGLYVELAIIVFCALILSQTGRTRGPVFDVVGPDFLPTVVAGLVLVLTLVQVAVHLARGVAGSPERPDEPITPADAVVGLIFAAITVAYVVLLSIRVLPYWAATALFTMATATLLARSLNLRDVAVSAALGLGLGIGLQLIFTRVLIIDLPA